VAAEQIVLVLVGHRFVDQSAGIFFGSGATLGYAESIAEVGQCNAQVQQWGPCTAWFKRAVGVLKDYTPHGDEHAARRDELVAEYQELVKMSDGFAASPSAFPALYRGDDATGVE